MPSLQCGFWVLTNRITPFFIWKSKMLIWTGYVRGQLKPSVAQWLCNRHEEWLTSLHKVYGTCGNSTEGQKSQAVSVFPHGFILQGHRASFTKANPSDLTWKEYKQKDFLDLDMMQPFDHRMLFLQSPLLLLITRYLVF